MKTCSVCGDMKKEAEMSLSPAIVCKACYPDFAKKCRREYQTKNRERLKPYVRKWQKDNYDKIKEQKKIYNAKYYAAHHPKSNTKAEREMKPETIEPKPEVKPEPKMKPKVKYPKAAPWKQPIRKNPHVTKYGTIYVNLSDLALKYGWNYGQVFAIVCEDKRISLTPIPESKSCLYEANLLKSNYANIGKQYAEKAGFAPLDPYILKDENGVLKILKVEKVPDRKSVV